MGALAALKVDELKVRACTGRGLACAREWCLSCQRVLYVCARWGFQVIEWD